MQKTVYIQLSYSNTVHCAIMDTQCESICRNGNRCSNMARIQGEDKKHMCMKHFNCQKKKDDCVICFESMTPSSSIKLECGHFFHATCLEIWTEQNETCPMCRAPVHVKNMVDINKNYISLLGYMLFSMPRERRTAAIYHIENLITHT